MYIFHGTIDVWFDAKNMVFTSLISWICSETKVNLMGPAHVIPPSMHRWCYVPAMNIIIKWILDICVGWFLICAVLIWVTVIVPWLLAWWTTVLPRDFMNPPWFEVLHLRAHLFLIVSPGLLLCELLAIPCSFCGFLCPFLRLVRLVYWVICSWLSPQSRSFGTRPKCFCSPGDSLKPW